MVGVEAQAAGTPCVFSAEVTEEVVILPESSQIPLKASDSEWADRISACADCGDRLNGLELVRQAGYDINIETEKITKIYLELANRE